ncbi:hypothetical protein GE09DRAFT_304826 [Coniochaeta sp. 2T2.1]|nr:hypothetical protein GE09DRAFT_304826 [Coniochaeta sp. 2T2.1]
MGRWRGWQRLGIRSSRKYLGIFLTQDLLIRVAAENRSAPGFWGFAALLSWHWRCRIQNRELTNNGQVFAVVGRVRPDRAIVNEATRR